MVFHNMKVALLVFPIHYSHGCLLQTYALYSKLKELGCEVTVLDRQPERTPFFQCGITILKRLIKKLLFGYKGDIFYRNQFPMIIMAEQQHFIDRFRKDIISVHSSLELQKVMAAGNFQAIVVGSDQTWRPKYVPNVMDYWLDFAESYDILKVAYAPSFGTDEWEYSEGQTERCKSLASRFSALSVREDSGVSLCVKYLNVDAMHVLDPTLLHTQQFYYDLLEVIPERESFCQCYFLDRTEEKEAIANLIASQMHLAVNYINTKTEDTNASVKDRIAPSVEKWLTGFIAGKFMVVDSFHAMVFSIIFQRDFVVIGNKKRGLSRFQSLLKGLGLADRLVLNKDEALMVAGRPINWDNVQERLNYLRDKSYCFLETSLRYSK